MNRLKKFNIFLSVLIVFSMLVILTLQVGGFLAISNVQASLVETKYRIKKFSETSKNLESLEKKYKEVSKSSEKIYTALPSQKDSSELVSDLEALAKESDLKLVLVQSAISGKRKSNPDLSLLQTVKGKYSYEMPVEIRVQGSFINFSKFVTKIENYQRILNINSLEISKFGTSNDNIEAKVKLTAYLKK